tara:strand:+ start:427 stop:642 length:216 start_codon:yes stop_codon:yes gene_type:complete
MKISLRKYRILEIAETKGYKSLKELSGELELHPTALSQLVANNTNFTKETLEKLLTVLDCDLGDIVEAKKE